MLNKRGQFFLMLKNENQRLKRPSIEIGQIRGDYITLKSKKYAFLAGIKRRLIETAAPYNTVKK